MKLNIFKMIDPTMKKMLVGGVVGSLSYWADLAMADTQTAYPAVRKDRLAPQLPRNDELLTSFAPPAIMYVLGKKKAKIAQLAKGTVLYSLPHLMQRIVVNAVAPIATVSFASSFRMPPVAMQNNAAMKIYPRPIPVTTRAPSAVMGKYR